MRTRDFAIAIGVLAVAGASAVAVKPQLVFGVVPIIGLVWAFGRQCAHPHASLLPPVAGAGPDRDHARWYCDRCGREWPATINDGARPRAVYEGFDEALAARSAARAESLERQRRRLADKRTASRERRPHTAVLRPAARPGPRPVAIDTTRRPA
jgi:hypothetical protein